MRKSDRAVLSLTLGYFLCFLCLTVPPASASLGGGVDSIQADAKHLSAVLKKPRAREVGRETQGEAGRFSVQEMVVAGVSIREYLSPSGIVFGIAWDGPHHPNFRTLLGSYQGEYDSAVEKQGGGKHRGARGQKIQSENLVVQYHGHLRDMKGVAYVPTLLPSGVSVDEIQ